MPAHPITDDLLKAMVGIKSDAGVSSSRIEALIDSFGERADTQEGRQELLSALAELMPEPGQAPKGATPVSAAVVWQTRILDDLQGHRTGDLVVGAFEPDAPAEDGGRTDSEGAGQPVDEQMLSWLDLESLTGEIGELGAEYRTARASENFAKARAINLELERAIAARDRLLSRLTKWIAAGC